VQKLNGLLRSEVLYRGIGVDDEKSAGTGPRRVVPGDGVEAVVDVDNGM
jgi:hypothetical protein